MTTIVPANYSGASKDPAFKNLIKQRLAKYSFDSDEVNAFAAYLENASEVELYRMNPRRAAALAEIDLRRSIEMSALAVREGLFDLCNAPLGLDNLSG